MDDELPVLDRIQKVSNLVDRLMAGVKADLARKFPGAKNISAIQGRIILYLHAAEKKGEVFQKDIENRFDIRSSTAAVILGRMEHNRLIVRETCPGDERKKTVRLTRKARDLHPKAQADIERAEKHIVAPLSKRELAAFLSALDKIADNLS